MLMLYVVFGCDCLCLFVFFFRWIFFGLAVFVCVRARERSLSALHLCECVCVCFLYSMSWLLLCVRRRTHVLVAAAAAVETCQKCFALWHILLSLPRDAFCPLTHTQTQIQTHSLSLWLSLPSEKNMYFEISSTTNSILCHNFPIESSVFLLLHNCAIYRYAIPRSTPQNNESVLIVESNIWSRIRLHFFYHFSQFAAMFCFSINHTHSISIPIIGESFRIAVQSWYINKYTAWISSPKRKKKKKQKMNNKI